MSSASLISRWFVFVSMNLGFSRSWRDRGKKEGRNKRSKGMESVREGSRAKEKLHPVLHYAWQIKVYDKYSWNKCWKALSFRVINLDLWASWCQGRKLYHPSGIIAINPNNVLKDIPKPLHLFCDNRDHTQTKNKVLYTSMFPNHMI